MDRKIQLIAADLDGTLMNEHKEISDRNWKAIEQAAKKGVKTVLATGRTLAVIPQNIAEHPLLRYGVCSNGAAVIELKTGKNLSESSLESLAQEALEQIHDRKYQTELMVLDVDDILLYGVAFSGKDVRVRSRSLSSSASEV